MRDWHAYVRERLSLPGLTPERESRVVRELAAQLDDFHREALARGFSAAEDMPGQDGVIVLSHGTWQNRHFYFPSREAAYWRPIAIDPATATRGDHYLAITPIQMLNAGSIPRAADIALDGRVLGFAFLLSIATGVLFGLVPAWQASRNGLGAVLKEGGRSSSTSGGRWMRSALLVAEVALSIVLLVGAALLLRSFSRLTNVDPGFRSEKRTS